MAIQSEWKLGEKQKQKPKQNKNFQYGNYHKRSKTGRGLKILIKKWKYIWKYKIERFFHHYSKKICFSLSFCLKTRTNSYGSTPENNCPTFSFSLHLLSFCFKKIVENIWISVVLCLEQSPPSPSLELILRLIL